MSDEELYLDFIAGNQESCDILFNKYKDELLKFAYLFVKDVQFAEDIVQETFLYIVQNPNKYNNNYSVKSYLYIVCKGKACNFRRDIRKRKLIESDSLENYLDFSDFKDTASVVIERENKRNIARAMNLLNYQYRTAIYLVDFRGLSYKDASIILGKSENQFKILIHRARAKLQKIILNDFTKENRKKYKRYDEKEYENNGTKEKTKKACKTGIMFITVLVACTTTILCVNPNIINTIKRQIGYTLGDRERGKLLYGPLRKSLLKKANYYTKLLFDEDITFNEVIEIKDAKENRKFWRVKKNNEISIDISDKGELKYYLDNRDVMNSTLKCKNIEELEEYSKRLCEKLSLDEFDLLDFKITEKEIILNYIPTEKYNEEYKLIKITYNKNRNNVSSILVTNILTDNEEINITKEDAIKLVKENFKDNCEIKNINLVIEEFRLKNENEKKEFHNKTMEEVLETKREISISEIKMLWRVEYKINGKNKVLYVDSENGELLNIEE